MGCHKEVKRWEKYIDLRNIPELAFVKTDETGIEFGTTVTISKAIEALRELSKCMPSTEGGIIFRKTADHMEKIASGFIRNTASLGGNLVMAQRFHFPSDIATLAFGAYGTQHAIRARKVEETLTGKVLSLSVLREAIEVVKATIVADYGSRDPTYGSSLAVGFVFKFLSPLVESRAKTENNSLNGYKSAVSAGEPNLTRDCGEFQVSQISSLLSSASQVVELNKEYYPVGKPIKKSEAAIQASGEAVYVDDIPSPANCLHGAFIYSTRPLAWVNGIRTPSSVPSTSIFSIISFQDTPDGGQNVGSKTIFGLEPLFADELAHCAGQPIAFVVADTHKHADMAVDSAVVDYDVDNLETPILSLEEAVERSSFFKVPSFLYPSEVGDLSKGMAEADNKILSAKTALAVPDEDNCMVIYSSIQGPESAHNTIAACLGILGHNVCVITRWVGGGFGGKAVRAMAVAMACALAAHKLRCPVSILNDESIVVEVRGIELGQGLGTKGVLWLGAPHLKKVVKLLEFVVIFWFRDSLNLRIVYRNKWDLLHGRCWSVRRTRILRVDIIYDCGKSLNPAIDLGQIEGAFVQGLGFFMLEEYLTNSEGLVVADGTWTYKIPTLDTITKEFNVEILISGHHQKRVLSSKGLLHYTNPANLNSHAASGEPPLLLSVSVYCAARAAIKEARKQLLSWSGHDESNPIFQLGVPATMPVVKGLCGLNGVESYLDWRLGKEQKV
ncbi:hypothetical protein NL676_004600 [Syzygium grande]|nr:hypothetical protein NL676_004600 [Syzygium grande]